MNSLFSSFVPLSSFQIPLNWISGLMVMLIIPHKYWMNNNQSMVFFKKVLCVVNKEMMSIFGKWMSPGSVLLPMSLFMYIAMNNFLGLLPYVFTSSSHLTFTMSFGIPLWVGYMSYSIMMSFENTMAHFLPLSTPVMLIPLMILIEIISSLIRPITLSVRLAANMVAGHLLLSLVSQDMPKLGVFTMMVCFLLLIMLMVLEMAVGVIQAYVFSLLMTLYIQESASSSTMVI